MNHFRSFQGVSSPILIQNGTLYALREGAVDILKGENNAYGVPRVPV